jgi:ribosome-associated protein
MLIDYGDIVVHAFTEEQRSFYGLERLWADAPVVPYEGNGGSTGGNGGRAEDAEAAEGAATPWYTVGSGAAND